MDMLFGGATASMLLGLSFGASACIISCIPTLGVAMMTQPGNASTIGLAWRFNAGRWLGYSLLGMVSGGIGVTITEGLDSRHAGWLLGGLLMLTGLLLWKRSASGSCGKHGNKHDDMFRGGIFGMGLGVSLTPCAPLAGVCVAAAASGSLWAGGLLGAAFGLGAVMPAQLLLGYGLSAAGAQLRAQLSRKAPQMGRIGGTILLLTGAGVIAGLIRL